jgi:hypothetical protein
MLLEKAPPTKEKAFPSQTVLSGSKNNLVLNFAEKSSLDRKVRKKYILIYDFCTCS